MRLTWSKHKSDFFVPRRDEVNLKLNGQIVGRVRLDARGVFYWYAANEDDPVIPLRNSSAEGTYYGTAASAKEACKAYVQSCIRK